MRFLILALILAIELWPGTSPTHAAVANGFQDAVVVTSLSGPSVLAFAPDGRLFIGEKASGRIRVYKNGALLAQPFLDLDDFAPAGTYFDTFNERGLLGITFDPTFASNGFVYVYYSLCKTPANPPQPGTNTCQLAKNRVARFVANGDVVNPASHVVLLDDIDSDAGNHNSGWLGFGPLDAKLYVAAGDGGSTSAKAQNLASLNGKILRLNANGSVPSDNPFVGTSGARGEVWALGLRNPFRCRFASDGRLFCGDVGANGHEEIDVITRGANYGWPQTEGPFNAASFPQYTNPIHSYPRGNSSSSIILGDFGSKTSFPGNYQQSFFFADFARGFIQRALLSASGVAVQAVDDVVTGLGGNAATDLVAGPDGSLYYSMYSANQVRRLTAVATNRSPIAVASANPTSGVPPLMVQLSSAGSSDPDGDSLSYSWNFGDGTATSALSNPSHQYASAGTYIATLTVSDGKATPGPGTDTVTITVGRPPVIGITAPIDGAYFRAGDTIALAGSATDPEDGAMPASSLHWKIIFHHADHIHPYIDDLVGSSQSFATNTGGEPDPDVGYEIELSATDSTGLTGTLSVFILPVTTEFTLTTNPPGLDVTLDGQPVDAPSTTTSVVGLHRSIGAPPVQSVGGQTYYFAGWSDGGLPSHDIVTPEVETTFTASFMPPATCNAPVVIPTAGGSFTTATGGASSQSGTCANSTNSPEQVFQWTPSVSGTATIETCGGATSFDSVLYVRSGSCSGGAQVACADDTPGCGTSEPNDHHASRAIVSVTAGQTYFIVVDGFNGASGTFTLTVTAPSGVAPTPTRTTTPVRTSTPVATASTTPVLTPTRTATRTPTPVVTATRTPTPVVTATRTPTPVVTATRTATAVPTTTRTVTPVATTTPQPVATTTASASPGPCNPIQVPPQGGSFTGTTSGASGFAGTCAVTNGSPDQVYQWTPATSGTAIIGTCGGTTSFDTALYVRAGSCQGPQVACNDDTAGCATTEPNDHHASRATLTVTAGQTYFIVVDGYNGGSGTYTLTITPPAGASPTATRTTTPVPTTTVTATLIPTATRTTTPVPTTTVTATLVPTATRTTTPVPTTTVTATLVPTATRTTTPVRTATSTATRTPTPIATVAPPPDACADPTIVPADGGTFDGSTSASSTQAGSCGVTDKSGEQVFQWTPAVSGRATIGTCGVATLFDTVVYLRGATCGGGNELACIDDVGGCVTGEPNDHHGSRITPLVSAGTTYFILVDGYSGANGDFSLTITPPVAPTVTATATPVATASVTPTETPVATATNVPTRTATATVNPTATTTPIPSSTATPTANPSPADACADATVLPPEGGIFAGVTSGLSSQIGSCALTSKAPEQVFAWTPTTSGVATFSTCSSDTLYDTVLYVRGATCGGTELGCNDDTTGCGTGEPSTYHGSRVSRVVTAGTTYFIVVDGYDEHDGTFALTVTAPLPPTPTETRTATPIPTVTATVVPATATATVTSTPLRTATRTATPDPTVTPIATATAVAAATASPTALPTSVPDPCGATAIPAAGGTFAGVTSGSSAHNGSCGLSDKGPEAVFKWTPTSSGRATIGTCGSGTMYDTVLYMRTGSCGGSELGCNDDSTGCGTGEPNPYHGSRLAPTVTAGQTYYIVVDGYNGGKGAFSLTVTPPPDGSCNAPYAIPPGGGIVTGTTSGSSELGACGSTNLAGEDVYRWTPATSGVATLETCGDDTTYDTVLYIAADVCGAPAATCSDDTPGCGTTSGAQHGSRITPTVTAGQTYYVVVDGYNGRAGDYSLNVIPPP